jgi:CheY-like chemotaxis protein
MDDDPVFRATLQELLEGAGHRVLETCDRQEGLVAVQTHGIALVIADLRLLEQDGGKTLQQLQTTTPTPTIIAIASGGQTGRRELLQVTPVGGAARTLRQPVRFHNLLAFIHQHIG